MWKCKFKETPKTKGGKADLDKSGRRKSLSNTQKSSEVTKKPSERVVTRNLRRSVADDKTPRSRNNSSEHENPRKRKKKLIYSPEVTSRKSLDNKNDDSTKKLTSQRRKIAQDVPKKAKKRRIIVESESEEAENDRQISDNNNKTGNEIKNDSPNVTEADKNVSDDDSDDQPLLKSSETTSTVRKMVRNPLLIRKVKRESSQPRPVQKYETERMDYIKEEKPSHMDNKSFEYVCHETLTSRENSPKREGDKCQGRSRSDAAAAAGAGASSSSSASNSTSSRSLIRFQVGGRLEARDYLNMWYPSRIIQVDWDNREILIHFERWNSRFDEWVSMDSPRLRPITRTSTRKDARTRRITALKEFKIGEIVYAKWSDCKMYPAKIVKVNSDETYTVLFYDGFERDVQFINVKKLPTELIGKVNFQPEAMAKVREDKTRRLSGSKSSESMIPVDPGSSSTFVDKMAAGCVESQSKVKDEGKDGVGCGLSSSKAKRQQLKVKIGGGALTKIRKQSLDKSSSGRNSPHTTINVDENIKEKKSSNDEKQKSRSSITNPLLIQELSKAPLNETPLNVGIPSKAFLIEEDHNHFKCTISGCGKSFRKDVLLASHMKHYHSSSTTSKTPLPVCSSSVRKSLSNPSYSSSSEMKEENILLLPPADNLNSKAHVMSENIPETFTGNVSPVEGNKERKLITVKRRQLLMQRKLENQSKTKEQHISDVIASVAKKFNQTPSDRNSSTAMMMTSTAAINNVILNESPVKEVTPKPEKHKASPKRRRFLFSPKVMSKLRRMKMVSGSQTGKITNGRRITALDDGPQEELINCSCERAEEDGLMMQCEVCLAWQHGSCFGIEDESKVPEKYICHICKNPNGVRSSFRYCYNQDWFKNGELASFKCLPQRDTWNFRNNVYKTHGLAAQALLVDDVLHTLQYKLHIANNTSNSELVKWSRPWPKSNDTNENIGDELWGFSDHCYSVPNQEFTSDSLVDQNGLFFNEGSKELLEDVAANEILDVDGAPPSPEEKQKAEEEPSTSSASASTCDVLGVSDLVDKNVNSRNNQEHLSKEDEVLSQDLVKTELPSSESAEVLDDSQIEIEDSKEVKVSENFENDPVRWQLNLLDHIENVQQELDSRLDEIGKRIEVLEADYKYPDENLPKDSTSELSRTRRLLSCIINDLTKVRRMALYR
ncbi:hypothetical protein CHUAL_002754 [Chamberlinius hualienensis]